MTDHEALVERVAALVCPQLSPCSGCRDDARPLVDTITAEAKQQQRDADRLTVHVIRFDKDERKAGGPDNFYNGVLHAEVALAAAPLIGEDKSHEH